MDVPQARVAVIDGTAHAPGQPWKHGKHTVKTLWGELAWQLGGDEAFALVKEADANGTSPGKETAAEAAGAARAVRRADRRAGRLHPPVPGGQAPQRRHLRQQSLVRPGAHRSGEAGAERHRAGSLAGVGCRSRQPARRRGAAGTGKDVRPRAGTLEAGRHRGGVRDRAPPAVRAGAGRRRPATRSAGRSPTPTSPKGAKLPARRRKAATTTDC